MRKVMLAMLLLLVAMATKSEAQSYSYQATTRNIITTGAHCGSTAVSCNIVGTGAQYHYLTWNISGTLSACSVRVDGSADGITWGTGDVLGAQTCTSNGNALSTVHVVNFVRVNITSITPVSTANLTVNINGYQVNPTPGTGSVTSVGMTGDNTVFNTSVTGSPVTTTGTLAPSLHTQTANLVLAGPTSGGAVAPTFRSLVSGDLPAGLGSVTSVAMTGDGTVFNASVTGSPVTTSGTLAPALISQAANTVFAGPTSGGSVAPTFRTLVASDIPAGAGLPTGLITSDTVRYNEYGDAAWDKVAAIPAFVRLNADPANASMTTVGSALGSSFTGTPSILPATATESPMIHVTSAASGSTSIVLGNTWGFSAGVSRITRGVIRRYSSRLRMNGTTNVRYWIGLSDSLGGTLVTTGWATDTPNGNYIAFRFSSSTDSFIQACEGTSNVAQTCASTTVAVDTTNTQLLEIGFDSTHAYFYVNGVLTNTLSNNLPATSVLMDMSVTGDNKNTANAQSLDLESQQVVYK